MGCGRLKLTRFHWLILVVWQCVLIFCIQSVFPVFMHYKPHWACVLEDGNLEWTQNCTILEVCQGNLTFKSPFFSATQEFQLYCGLGEFKTALISTLYFVGGLIGALGFGHVSDIFGRKPVAVGLCIFGLLSGCITGIVPEWKALAAIRFLVGMAFGGIMNVHFTYIMEMILPQQRLFLRGFFNWGWARLTMPLICFFFPNWRHATALMSSILLPVLLIMVFLVPESPKWLQSHDRYSDWKRSLEWIARFNGQQQRELKVEDFLGTRERRRRLYTILDLFSSRSLATTTLVLWIMWFTASLSSYVNDLNSGTLAGDLFINQVLFSILIGLSKCLVFLVDHFVLKFNRRALHLISQCLVLLFYVSIIILFVQSAQDASPMIPVAITALSLLATVVIEYIWDACYVCSTELFPTVVRSIGTGSASVMARVGGILAPQMVFLATFWRAAPYSAVVIVGVANLIVPFFFLPDTKGIELADTLPVNKTREKEMEELTNRDPSSETFLRH